MDELVRSDGAPIERAVPGVERLLLRISEAAELAGVGRTTAYALVASGEWPSVTIGRAVRVPLAGLREWVAMRTTGTRRHPCCSRKGCRSRWYRKCSGTASCPRPRTFTRTWRRQRSRKRPTRWSGHSLAKTVFQNPYAPSKSMAASYSVESARYNTGRLITSFTAWPGAFWITLGKCRTRIFREMWPHEQVSSYDDRARTQG